RRIAARASDMLIDYMCANCGHPLSRTGRPSVVRVPNPFEHLQAELNKLAEQVEALMRDGKFTVKSATGGEFTLSSDGMLVVGGEVTVTDSASLAKETDDERQGDADGQGADGERSDTGGAGEPAEADEKA